MTSRSELSSAALKLRSSPVGSTTYHTLSRHSESKWIRRSCIGGCFRCMPASLSGAMMKLSSRNLIPITRCTSSTTWPKLIQLRPFLACSRTSSASKTSTSRYYTTKATRDCGVTCFTLSALTQARLERISSLYFSLQIHSASLSKLSKVSLSTSLISALS